MRKIMLVVSLCLTLFGGTTSPALASSTSIYNRTFTVAATANGQPTFYTITVEIKADYNSALDRAEYFCSAVSPGAIQAGLTCGQLGSSSVTGGVPGSAVTVGPIVTAYRTSAICFTTDFIYPASARGFRGRVGDCTTPVRLPF